MQNYETRLRERIRNLSKEDALDFLETMEFNVELKESWSECDYEYLDVIDKLRKELMKDER